MTWTRGKRTLVIGAAFLFVGFTAFVLQEVFKTTVVTLPDGSRVAVRQVSFGKRHRFVDGPPWKRALGGLPTRIAAPLGIRPQLFSTAEETLVIWFQWQLGTNYLPYPQWLRVIDSNGLASAATYLTHLINHTNSAFAGFDITSFPRDEPTLLLELRKFETPAARHLANFRIPNPSFGKRAAQPSSRRTVQRRQRPAWSTWPASAFVDGEQFTLLAINTGLSATGSLAGNTLSNQWTEVLFRIGTNEPAQRSTNFQDRGSWVIDSIELRDAVGNSVAGGDLQGRIFPMGTQYMSRRDDGIALVPGAIWPDETWNVRTVFNRVATPSLDAAHRWTTSVHIPDLGETNSLNQTGQVEGYEIRLESIEHSKSNYDFGAGPVRIRAVMRSPQSAHVSRRGQEARVVKPYAWEVLNVEDQRGSNVLHTYSFATSPQQQIRLRPPAESTDLKITFGLTHPVTVELSGKASILRTNVARWAAGGWGSNQ